MAFVHFRLHGSATFVLVHWVARATILRSFASSLGGACGGSTFAMVTVFHREVMCISVVALLLRV